ncbi:MAG: PAC2 family protein [Acidimicrobiia bacterium]
MSELVWIGEPIPALRRPILVLAFEGLFDIAGVATSALTWLTDGRAVRSLARIDPDSFYDFSERRPVVWLDDAGDRHLSWPENEAKVLSIAGASHDLIVLTGVEPHVRWKSFAACLIELATRTKCETVVTVGGAAERVPHTRSPGVFGSSTNAALAAALGLSRPHYQGPTGLLGVLHEQLDRAGVPAISLRVPVPHYLVNAEHPQSTAALLRHLERVLGVPTRHEDLAGEVRRWREMHDTAVQSDPAAHAYVQMLERDFDLAAEASMPTADNLAADFEAFLRAHNETPTATDDDNDNEADGGSPSPPPQP